MRLMNVSGSFPTERLLIKIVRPRQSSWRFCDVIWGRTLTSLEEYAEDGKPLTYGQAKDLILEWDIPQPSRTKKGARFSKRRSANLSTGTGCLLISVAFILIISFYGGCK